MSTELSIALVQHVSTPGDIDASLARMSTYVEQASKAGVDLLLFPEASVTGYNNTLEVNQQLALDTNGETCEKITALARQNNIAIAYGFAEKADGQYYNSVQFVDETGRARSLYRKTHLWGEQDRYLFTEGDDLVPVFEWRDWQIGMLICYDIEFPENVRRLALEGAQLILTPTALMSPWTTVADLVVPARAYENQVFIAYANFCGHEYEQHYVGHSCIAGPDGVDLAKAADAEIMLNATISKNIINDTRDKLPYHRDRRPTLYNRLVE